MTKANQLEVLKPISVPKLSSGDDDVAAKQLTKLFTDAQNGMRRIVALGLFAWEIKETRLKHSEWGPWLAAHAPSLCQIDSVTKKPKASHALQNYMSLTKGVLEAIGFPTIEKYFDEISKFARGANLETVAKFPKIGNLKSGGFLLLPDKKVPAEIKPLRDQICTLIDGKTQRQLFLEFKQAEEQPDGTTRKKHGRLKGSSGNTKEQRARAAELEAQERITEKKLKAREIAEWLLDVADDKGLGEILGTEELSLLDQAMEAARGYIKTGGGK